MKYNWKDLPEGKNLFTIKNTAMVNLDTGKIIQHYATNTKIVVVQKCITTDKTYYRTKDAAAHKANYAFEAEAFGLPNEKAPLASRAPKPSKKQKSIQKTESPKGGERDGHLSWIKRLFRKNNG